jgi:uncharacterized membrane protein
MTKILEKLPLTLAAGLVLAILVAFSQHADVIANNGAHYLVNLTVWLHVVVGIMWIGLLWYFNFVQIPTMPSIPAELKPAVGKFIAPKALFWFRWAALATVVTGLVVAVLKGYAHQAMTFQPGVTTIGIGMWIALVMAFNVWFLIWPNQKRALGIVVVDDATKAKSARIAMLASRTNTLLSLPMLYCMVSQNIVG